MRTLLFDFDGTLFDLRTDWAALRRALAQRLPQHFTPEARQHAEILFAWFRSASRAERQPILDLIAGFEAEGVARGAFYPDARELLEDLAARGARYGVLTRNCLRTIELAFANVGLAAPAAIVALDDDIAPKPDLAAAQLLARRLGVALEQCLMIGDALPDVHIAERAGIPLVLRKSRHELPAEKIVASFTELDRDWLLSR